MQNRVSWWHPSDAVLGLRTALLLLAIPLLGHAQSPPCSPHAEWKGSRIRLKSADGKEHILDALNCYPGYLQAHRKGKWALLDQQANFKTDFEFDALEPFDRGMAAVRVSGRAGYIGMDGHPVIPLRYEKIRSLGSDRFLARDSSGWYLLDRSGHSVDGDAYEKVSGFIDGYAVTRRDHLYGLINDQGKLISPPQYDEITKFFEGLAMISRDGLWGHMDAQGREIIPPQYDEVFVFFDSLSIARKGEFWGFINRSNKTIIPFEYDHLEYFDQGRALVSRDGRWGYIDIRGRELIPIVYDRIQPFYEGIAKVESGGKQGYIRENGESLIPPIYDEIYRFVDGVAITRSGENYGFVTQQGQVLSQPVWSGLSSFRGSIARVQSGDKFGLINREGVIVLPPEFDEIGTYEGGMVSVRRGMEWMFVDAMPRDGPLELDPQRAAKVKINDQWGYIDQQGRAYGFSEDQLEFVDTEARLGSLQEGQKAAYTFHFRNNSASALSIASMSTPCGCEALLAPGETIQPGQFGQIHLNCETLGIRDDWQVRVPVHFKELSTPLVLQMSASRPVPDSAMRLLDVVPINGRYVFLMDISASMDELPLAKMVFSRLAASLCKDDNISIVSFNSFSQVELRPTTNHSEVVHTIRQLRPSLKTDAARGLRLSYNILSEPLRSLEKHIFMASDGDIDPGQLRRIQESTAGSQVQLTVFVFSYTGDPTAYEKLSRDESLSDIHFVYVDRENISGVLEEEYTDIGCLAPPAQSPDTLGYQMVARAPYGDMLSIRDRRRLGLVDHYENMILPPVYEWLDFPGRDLVRTRLGKAWHLHDGCRTITRHSYDSIGVFQGNKAFALREGTPVLLDYKGREYDYLTDWSVNPVYSNTDTLAGQPHANIVILLDVSASMNLPDRLPLLQEAFRHFSALLRYEDQVAIVTYSQQALLALNSVSASKRQLILDVLNGLSSRGNTDPLLGLDMALRQAGAAYLPSGNNRVILATDGRFDMTEDLVRLLDRFKARKIHLSVYLFGSEEKKIHADNLKKLAARAGGSYHHATPDNIQDLLLREVLSIQQAAAQ